MARRVENRLVKLARFADVDVMQTPGRLRKPFSQKTWRSLAPDIRLAHLKVTITKQIEEDLAAKEAEALARANEVPAPAKKVALSPAVPSRYVVACIAGCGRFHPATSGRPVIVACGGQERSTKKRKHSIYDMDTSDLLAAFRRESKSRTTSARTPQAQRSATGRAPKKRRRATCSNSR
ncbi:hypothetical protein AR539_10830 [Arthrobacter sp. EPSL27]|nr:hypothetical protein AR539_10830 [Arthrobacter sp. EPSL27]